MRKTVTLSVMRICVHALLAVLLVLIIIVPTTSTAEEPDDVIPTETGGRKSPGGALIDLHNLEPGGREATILTGRAHDIWSIELRECPTSLDLRIVDSHDYSEDDGWSPDAEDVYSDWHVSAGSGRWQWVQPTDYQWVLLVSNPHLDEMVRYQLTVEKNVEETEKEEPGPRLYCLTVFLIALVLANIALIPIVTPPK